MKTYEEISRNDLRNLLDANWITHDSMWLLNSTKKYGMKEVNAINKLSVRMMAVIETKRLKKVMEAENPKSFEELKMFLLTAFEIIRGNFMKFELNFQEPETITWNVPQCFAYDGVTRIGVIDDYDCGIVERIMGWFEELGVSYKIHPSFTGCLMHKTGKCPIRFEVNFSLGSEKHSPNDD